VCVCVCVRIDGKYRRARVTCQWSVTSVTPKGVAAGLVRIPLILWAKCRVARVSSNRSAPDDTVATIAVWLFPHSESCVHVFT
jgi:hypothetical protein